MQYLRMEDRVDMVKAVAGLLAFLAILGGGGYWVWHHMSQQEEDRKADEAAFAVTDLPAGVEKNWLAYIDRRMAAIIHRRGMQLYIKDAFSDTPGGAGTFVSTTMPYAIDCSFEGQIKFGSGDDAIEVRVFEMNGDTGKSTPGGAADPQTNDGEPMLGVSALSKAADTLRQTLCNRIAEDLQALLKT